MNLLNLCFYLIRKKHFTAMGLLTGLFILVVGYLLGSRVLVLGTEGKEYILFQFVLVGLAIYFVSSIYKYKGKRKSVWISNSLYFLGQKYVHVAIARIISVILLLALVIGLLLIGVFLRCHYIAGWFVYYLVVYLYLDSAVVFTILQLADGMKFYKCRAQ